MSIVNVKEMWSDRDGGFNADFSRRYTRVFRVETNATSDGPIAVAFATGIPRVWDRYVSHETGEFDDLALCRSVDPRQDADNPYLWEVRCEYTTESFEPGTNPPSGGAGGAGGSDPSKPGSGSNADNPETRPWEVEYEPETFRFPARYAFDSQDGMKAKRILPILNPVKQPYDPLPEYEVGCDVLTITRIEANPDHKLLRQYAYALNDDVFLHAKFTEAQMMPVRRKQIWIGGRRYWECTYRIRFCPEEWGTWQPQILNTGRRELQGDPPDETKEPIEIRDPISHQPVNDDWPIGKNGKAMTREEIAAAKIDDFYTTWYMYRVLPFSALNLTL